MDDNNIHGSMTGEQTPERIREERIRELKDLTNIERGSLIEIYIKMLSMLHKDVWGERSKEIFESRVDELLDTGLTINIQGENQFYFKTDEAKPLPYEQSMQLRDRPALALVRPYDTFDRLREDLISNQLDDYMEKVTFKRKTTYDESIKILALNNALNHINNLVMGRAAARVNKIVGNEFDKTKREELQAKYMQSYLQTDYTREFEELYRTVYGHVLSKRSRFKDTLKTSQMINELGKVIDKEYEDRNKTDYVTINTSGTMFTVNNNEEQYIRAINLLCKYHDDPKFQEYCQKVFEVRGITPVAFHAIERVDLERRYVDRDNNPQAGFEKIEYAASLVTDKCFDHQIAMAPFNQGTYGCSTEEVIKSKNLYAGIVKAYAESFTQYSFQLSDAARDFKDANKNPSDANFKTNRQRTTEDDQYLVFKAGLSCMMGLDENAMFELAKDKAFWSLYKDDSELLLGTKPHWLGKDRTILGEQEKPLLSEQSLLYGIDYSEVVPICKLAFDNLYATRQKALIARTQGFSNEEEKGKYLSNIYRTVSPSAIEWDLWDSYSITQEKLDAMSHEEQRDHYMRTRGALPKGFDDEVSLKEEDGVQKSAHSVTKEEFLKMTPEQQDEWLVKYAAENRSIAENNEGEKRI